MPTSDLMQFITAIVAVATSAAAAFTRKTHFLVPGK